MIVEGVFKDLCVGIYEREGPESVCVREREKESELVNVYVCERER